MADDSGPAGNIEPKAKIFISYSRKDMAFADRLEAALKARGFEPLIDRADIYAFEDWWARIQELIRKADTVVFVLSPDTVASDVAVKEVNYAASLNKRLAPIVFRPVDDSAVPQALRRLNFIFFDEPDRFEINAEHLAAALRTDIGWVRRHTEFGEQARRWSAAGRPGPRGLLLRSPLLEEAERWIAAQPNGAPAPSPDTAEFIAQSRKAATARRRRTQIFAVVLVAIMVAAAVAWRHERELNEAIYWFFHMRGQTLTADKEHALRPKDDFRDCSDCPEMVVIPAGTFTMGGTDTGTLLAPIGNEPRHKVTIARPFAVSKYALTFAEWDTCAAHGDCDPHIDDNHWGRDRRPVINVSWEDAQRYVAWLSRMTGQPYRLLTEAEWEYAARGGTTTEYYWGDASGEHDGHANCADCGSSWDDRQTAPVGSFAPNPFGLYDMLGNVYQWVLDCDSEDYDDAPTDGSAARTTGCDNHINRGGAWDKDNFLLSAAARDSSNKGNRASNIGFRIARALIVSVPDAGATPGSAAANPPPSTAGDQSAVDWTLGPRPQLAWPVHGKLIAQKVGNKDNGIDIAASEGTPITAAADGVVAFTGDRADAGNYIILRHGGGYATLYSHARELLVKQGTPVHQGQIIARVGRSGSVSSPQLHFSLTGFGTPIDPIPLLPKQP
jgi:formylglycine-generating enzyme required for sulfatase activity